MRFYIETERLILRDLMETDVDGIFELDSNPEVHRYLGNNPISSMQKAHEIVRSIQLQYSERGIGRFAAIEKYSGDFIGWSGLKYNTGEKETLGDKRDFHDIGYRFIPRYWGKGYATESSLAILQYGFNELDLQTIYGAAEVGNIASNKVLQKIGLEYVEQFPYEGEMINWYKIENSGL